MWAAVVNKQADWGVGRLVWWGHRRVRGTAGLLAGADHPTDDLLGLDNGRAAIPQTLVQQPSN